MGELSNLSFMLPPLIIGMYLTLKKLKNLESINELKKILKDGGDTKVLIRMKSKDKNYAFNLKTSKLIDASIVSVLNSSGFECKIH